MELDFPRPVAEMCADLAGQGFDVVDERRGGADERGLVLHGPVRAGGTWLDTLVLITAESGRWSISLRFEGMSRWITPQTWLAYLDGADPARLDLAAATRFVRDRLPEAARVISSTPQAERALARLAGDRSG